MQDIGTGEGQDKQQEQEVGNRKQRMTNPSATITESVWIANSEKSAL